MRCIRLFFIIFCLISSLHAKIYEQDADGNLRSKESVQWQNTEQSPYDELPDQDFKGSLLKMFFSLLGLVALLVFSIWFIRRFIRNKMEMSYKSSAIQVVEKRTISPKSILYIVEVDGKRILLSESQFEVRCLEKLPESTES